MRLFSNGRDASGRTAAEHEDAAADGQEAQARRADRRGDNAAADRHRGKADIHRRTAQAERFPL